MTHDACPDCGTAKHPLLACPACGYTHRLRGAGSAAETPWSDWRPDPARPPDTASAPRATPRITIKRRRRIDAA